MSKDKACITAIQEVCKRCPLYKENCGMLDFPSQCVHSGHFIDGYHQAEKDLGLTWEDIKKIHHLVNEVSDDLGIKAMHINIYQEALKHFNKEKKKK